MVWHLWHVALFIVGGTAWLSARRLKKRTTLLERQVAGLREELAFVSESTGPLAVSAPKAKPEAPPKVAPDPDSGTAPEPVVGPASDAAPDPEPPVAPEPELEAKPAEGTVAEVMPTTTGGWERFIGGNGLMAVGAIVVAVGVLFLLGFAMVNIGPMGRVLLSSTIAAGLFASGLVLERKEKLKTVARGLLGSGLALGYVVTFAAHAIESARVIESAEVGMLALALITSAGTAFSLRYKRQAVAVAAGALTFLSLGISATWVTPMWTVVATLFAATAGVVVAGLYRWRTLAWSSLIAAQILIGVRFAYATPGAELVLPAVVALLVLHAGAAMWTARRKEEDLLLLPVGALAGMVTALGYVSRTSSAWVPVLVAVLAGVAAFVHYRRGATATGKAALTTLVVGLAAASPWVLGIDGQDWLAVEVGLATATLIAARLLANRFLERMSQGWMVLGSLLAAAAAVLLPLLGDMGVSVQDASVGSTTTIVLLMVGSAITLAAWWQCRDLVLRIGLIVASYGTALAAITLYADGWEQLAGAAAFIPLYAGLGVALRRPEAQALSGLIALAVSVAVGALTLATTAPLTHSLWPTIALVGTHLLIEKFGRRGRVFEGVGLMFWVAAAPAAGLLLRAGLIASDRPLMVAPALALLGLACHGLATFARRPAALASGWLFAIAGLSHLVVVNLAELELGVGASILVPAGAVLLSSAMMLVRWVGLGPATPKTYRALLGLGHVLLGYAAAVAFALTARAALPSALLSIVLAGSALGLVVLWCRPGGQEPFGTPLLSAGGRVHAQIVAALFAASSVVKIMVLNLSLTPESSSVGAALVAVVLLAAGYGVSWRADRARVRLPLLAAAVAALTSVIVVRCEGGWLTAWLGLEAAGLVVVGLFMRERIARYLGLAAFAGIGLKLVLVDLSSLSMPGRIASFITLGLMMMAVSVLYARLSSRIES